MRIEFFFFFEICEMLKLVLLTLHTLVNYLEKNLPTASRKKVFPAVASLFC